MKLTFSVLVTVWHKTSFCDSDINTALMTVWYLKLVKGLLDMACLRACCRMTTLRPETGIKHNHPKGENLISINDIVWVDRWMIAGQWQRSKHPAAQGKEFKHLSNHRYVRCDIQDCCCQILTTILIQLAYFTSYPDKKHWKQHFSFLSVFFSVI